VLSDGLHTGVLSKVTGVEEFIMMRKLIAAAAVSGSLGLGAIGIVGTGGVAGAASAPSTTPTTATTATKCADAEKLATLITTLEGKATTWLPTAQAREAKATAAGHTKLATAISKRIARVQKWEGRGNARLAKISAKCGSAATAS
jgi:hypothetical protein